MTTISLMCPNCAAAEARATAAADRLEDETRRREKAEEKLRIAERQAVMASEITAEANARATAAEGERDALRAEAAEAQGGEKALHGHLNALARDVKAYLKDIDSRGAAFSVVCRLADVEAALALPYSPQGRPPEVMSGRLGGGGK